MAKKSKQIKDSVPVLETKKAAEVAIPVAVAAPEVLPVQTISRRLDKTPEQALRDDWPKRHFEIGPYITEKGKVRGGLKPSDQEKAWLILREYGFQIV